MADPTLSVLDGSTFVVGDRDGDLRSDTEREHGFFSEDGGRASHAADAGPCAYSSDPGVVSVSPVSRSVFSPDRTIGQPP